MQQGNEFRVTFRIVAVLNIVWRFSDSAFDTVNIMILKTL